MTGHTAVNIALALASLFMTLGLMFGYLPGGM
jgi:hypothetical protein